MKPRAPFLIVCSLVGFAAFTGCRSYSAAVPGVRSIPDTVVVTENRFSIRLEPETGSPNRPGIIFYPGGLVEPDAYVTILARLAEQGHPVVIVKMPLNLAVTAPNRANRFLDAPCNDRAYVIAGHSLGGAMAARFVAREVAGSSPVAGIVLLGAYPPQRDPLVGSPVPVLSIYAQNDGLVSEEERRDALSNLPESATIIVIEGGNHAGFGDYGAQDGDGVRTISLDTQHSQTVAAITEFLKNEVEPFDPGC